MCPFVSAATTTAVFIFHPPSCHCIFAPAKSERLVADVERCGKARSTITEQVSGWIHGTASEPRSISDERCWCSFVALYPCWILDCSLVVQSRIPRHARNGSLLFAAGPAGLARVVRYQLRGRDRGLPGSRNLCTLVVRDQPADPLCFDVDIPQEWVLFLGRRN